MPDWNGKINQAINQAPQFKLNTLAFVNVNTLVFNWKASNVCFSSLLKTTFKTLFKNKFKNIWLNKDS